MIQCGRGSTGKLSENSAFSSMPLLTATMFFRLGSLLLAVAAVVSAYTTPKQSALKTNLASPSGNGVANKAFAAAASASLAFVLAGSPLNAEAASKTAGQISLNSIPPTSVNVDLKDLPVVGSLVSGTYTRVDDKDVSSPSISIKSPKDKIGAIKAVATGGHLELDLDGILATHVDIDLAADTAGTLTAKVLSPLIPKLPFKNSASSSPPKGKTSEWNAVTNMGDGETYYFNTKTQETTYDKPSKL
mmetsp:Transcript_37028/g.84587  ORF Transcript_37028/g.84587 Transcript_37028/m.84587 type:complete len:246 (-) Transcript_37028:124-861(-)